MNRNSVRRARGAEDARVRRLRPGGAELSVWPGVLAAALVALVYMAVASGGTFRFGRSSYPHHLLVADAWLHGQLNIREEILRQRSAPFYERYRAYFEEQFRRAGRRLTDADWHRLSSRLRPPSMHDWSYYDGKYYGYWGPMPAVLLLPYVALAGLQASDVLVSCLIGAGSVFLVFLMLREVGRLGFVPMSLAAAVALALLLGLGTVHFYLAVMGQVWFLSQIVAAFFLTLAMWCVLRTDRGWGWVAAAGAAFGASFLSRSSILVTLPFFFIAIFAVSRHMLRDPWMRTVRLAVAFCIPLAGCGAMAMAFNHARFGNAFEDGVRIQLKTNANPRFKRQYQEHGAFSIYYVPDNIYYYFVNPTLRRYPKTGALTFDPSGNSMFLVTPALLYVFLSYRRRNWLIVGAWAGAGACMVLLLLFMGSGWYNFGNRYLLDLLPIAILLIAAGMDGRLTRASALLIVLSIVVNAWGTYRFMLEQP